MAGVCTGHSYLTVNSVGKMTTYRLRQEAEKRGLLEDLRNVNHTNLLRRLVQDIVEEEHARERGTSHAATNQSRSEPESVTKEKSRLQRERDERKAAALERSKQRQFDKGYFHAKKLLNVKYERQQAISESRPETDGEQDVASIINPRRHKIYVR